MYCSRVLHGVALSVGNLLPTWTQWMSFHSQLTPHISGLFNYIWVFFLIIVFYIFLLPKPWWWCCAGVRSNTVPWEPRPLPLWLDYSYGKGWRNRQWSWMNKIQRTHHTNDMVQHYTEDVLKASIYSLPPSKPE